MPTSPVASSRGWVDRTRLRGVIGWRSKLFCLSGLAKKIRAAFPLTQNFFPMTRFRAAAIHFAICAVVGVILLALFWCVWYPSPLFKAVGGDEVFLMLLAVDVVLGPLLTLVVFKAGKKSLKFDLAVIGLVQVAALSYGVWTLLVGRPVYIAGLGAKFAVVQANEIDDAELKTANQSLPRWGPQWVGTRQATDKAERERILFSSLGGADYGHFPQHHVPLQTMRDELLKEAKPISELRKRNAANNDALTAWLTQRGYTDQSAVFQGLRARSQDMAVILDAKTAAVVGIAPFKPWD